MNPPSKDPAAENADLRARLALALAARDDLRGQCEGLMALIDELQQRVRDLEARAAAS